jgi:pyruvate/2-oxoglutarate dehydrogenase complex dihydrolipoamide dehydrogenase (E3) component
MSAEKRFDYDLAVIGAGSAGYAAAKAGGSAGLKTALIDGARELGGLCILRGCMPTKTLLHSAHALCHARHSGAFGVLPQVVGFNFQQIMARKDRLIEEFASYRREQLFNGPFDLIRANARFVDDCALALNNGEALSARNFILASGSIVAGTPLPQLKEVGYLTSDDALRLEKLPRSLIVLGGGAVAVEFAQFFARLDVKVTLVQRGTQLLKELDADAAQVIETVFRREGMTVFTGTQLVDTWKEGGLKGVSFKHEGQIVRVAAEEIFFGLGRVPNTSTLNLEAAGVSVDRGRIITNPELQTSAGHIYAAGDCRGLHEIVHLAVQQGEMAAHNIAFPAHRKSMDYRLLALVVFTDPQIAVVGLTEKEARINRIPYLAAKHPFEDHGKALIMEARDGFVKLLAHPDSGEIIGGAVVGLMGGELIHEIIAAMVRRMTVHELAAMPHYHPTLAEIWTYPAEELAERIPRG